MKKIFSVFVMVCMLLTSLSVGVSADYALSGEDHVFRFNTADEVGKYFKEGNWYLSDGTNNVKLGSFSNNNEFLGMDFKKIDLDANTLSNPGVASTLSIRTDIYESVQSQERGYYFNVGDSEVLTNENMNAVMIAQDTDGDGTREAMSGKVVKHTLYAFSKNTTGEPLVIDYAVTPSSNYPVDLDVDNMVVPASKLYSADNIPHKIDFLVYTTNTRTNAYTKIRAGVCYEIYIDGLYYAGGEFNDSAAIPSEFVPKSSRYSWVAPHIDISSDGTSAVTWADTEMYICTNPAYSDLTEVSETETGGKYLTLHAFDAVDSQLFQEVEFGDFSTERTLRTGFVNGVDSELATALETAYTSGSQVVTVNETLYEDPASIWGENASSNVSLVDTATGDVYGVADAADVSGTFENYYISVNGVYAKAEMEESEDPEVAAITYDAATKTATLAAASVPAGTEKLQIVVAAYDVNGKMEKIAASTSQTDLTSNITYTITDGNFPTDAAKYKVFVFESLTSAKPLMEALEQ